MINSKTNKIPLSLILAIGAIISSAYTPADTQSNPQIQWTIPHEKLSIARADLNVNKSQILADSNSIDKTRGLPILYIITGAVLLPHLSKAIIDVYKDWKYGQIIITQDKLGKLSITHDQKSPGGTIIFINKEGKISFHNHMSSIDSDKLLQLLVNATSKN